jgi:hypothetical protein
MGCFENLFKTKHRLCDYLWKIKFSFSLTDQYDVEIETIHSYNNSVAIISFP